MSCKALAEKWDFWNAVTQLRKGDNVKNEDVEENADDNRGDEKPKLVLSVIGDSTSFVPKPWPTSVFKKGLIDTAKGSKYCLILHKGSMEKVSSIVREAVDSFNVLQTGEDDGCIGLIGLLPVNHDGYSTCSNIHRHTEETYGMEYWKNSKSVFGDIYHINLGHGESYAEFHAALLKNISNKKIRFMELKGKLLMRVPVLTIVAEGDLDTIETVHQVLKRHLPVLVLKGSGKAADFIANFMEECKDDTEINDYIVDRIPLLFGITYNEEHRLPNTMKGIKEHGNLVTVLEITPQTTTTEFTDAVGHAILRTWSRKIQDCEIQRNHRQTEENGQTNNDKGYLVNSFDDTIVQAPVIEEIIASAYSGIESKEYHEPVFPRRQDSKVHTSNKVHPTSIAVTLNAFERVPTEYKEFMKDYKEILCPASLPLYYYMAYQFIQDMDKRKWNVGEISNDDTKKTSIANDIEIICCEVPTSNIKCNKSLRQTDTTENFRILLKEAMIADRDEYVSVLLDEEGVSFDGKHFSNVYEETLMCYVLKDKSDFQHILKWGSSSAIHSFKKAYHLRKLSEDVRNIPIDEDAIKRLPEMLNGFIEEHQNILFDKDDCDKIKGFFDTNQEKIKAYVEKHKAKSDVSYENELDNFSSRLCVQAGRQLCQALLGFPKKTYSKEEPNFHQINIYEDLLIWAILVNRPKLALLFWTKCDNQLLCAMLASCALQKMAHTVKSSRDQSFYDEMMEQSRIFADRALKLQLKLYKEDAELAMELMITNQTVWDITISPLQCAYENSMLEFISQSCCQRRLNKMWYNEIGTSLSGFWKKGLFGDCCCNFNVCCNLRMCSLDNTPKIKKFVTAPLTRFLVHYMFFLTALVCYSAFILTELEIFTGVESIKVYEWILYAYVLGDFLEEYRQLILSEKKIVSNLSEQETTKALNHSSWYKLKKYLYNFWNVLDVVSYMLTVAAVLVRFMKSSSTNKTARRLYSFSLFTMYMRFLHVILMSRKLGPKIIMIKEMLKDLFRFIGILFIFMMGVGVIYHANMYPVHVDMWNSAGWEYWRIWKIIYIPYWQIYGETFLETFAANSTESCTSIQSQWEQNPDMHERCNQYDWVLIVIAAFYMLISNLLLVNLVIAVFSYRFERVQEISEKLWRYLRYGVIMDFRSRIPAPLNLVMRPILFFVFCIKKARKCADPKPKKIDEEVWKNKKRITALQSIHAVDCAYETDKV